MRPEQRVRPTLVWAALSVWAGVCRRQAAMPGSSDVRQPSSVASWTACCLELDTERSPAGENTLPPCGQDDSQIHFNSKSFIGMKKGEHTQLRGYGVV